MKLFIILFLLWIGVQSQSLDDLNKEAKELAKENDKIAEELVKIYDQIKETEDEIKLINGNISVNENYISSIQKDVNDWANNVTLCESEKNKALKEKENLERLERRVDEVQQEEERHRDELKALEEEQKNHPAKLEALNRELNETQNNLKLLEPELQELRLKLNKCTEETKYCKVTYQSTGKVKTDGGGFINKIITSTLDNVNQLKKGVAKVLRSKINFLKFNIPE